MGEIVDIDEITRSARKSPEARARRHESRARSTHARFVRAVAEAGGWDVARAQACAVAVVATLEEELSIREVAGLEAQLPSILHEMLDDEPILDLPRMDAALFCRRVGARLDVPPSEARRVACVVLGVLRTHVSEGEARRIERRLPSDVKALWCA